MFFQLGQDFLIQTLHLLMQHLAESLGNQAQLPNGQSPAGGGALDQLKSGFGSLFQSESFTPSTFNPYG